MAKDMDRINISKVCKELGLGEDSEDAIRACEGTRHLLRNQLSI
jgi:hypothetical protein